LELLRILHPRIVRQTDGKRERSGTASPTGR
jgi:hypothetical protein